MSSASCHRERNVASELFKELRSFQKEYQAHAEATNDKMDGMATRTAKTN